LQETEVYAEGAGDWLVDVNHVPEYYGNELYNYIGLLVVERS
jgi:hypothetical protein